MVKFVQDWFKIYDSTFLVDKMATNVGKLDQNTLIPAQWHMNLNSVKQFFQFVFQTNAPKVLGYNFSFWIHHVCGRNGIYLIGSCSF